MRVQNLLAEAQTAYFVSIVIVQWADLLICKTRKLSLFQQGLKNPNLNRALVFETCLAAALTYVPGMDTAFQTSPMHGVHWLPALPFSLLIFVFDECRKYFIRKHGTEGFAHRELYW